MDFKIRSFRRFKNSVDLGREKSDFENSFANAHINHEYNKILVDTLRDTLIALDYDILYNNIFDYWTVTYKGHWRFQDKNLSTCIQFCIYDSYTDDKVK